MTNPQKAKGDAAEREIAKLLAAELGVDVVRKLGAGRKEDTGDLYGLPLVTAQVKNFADVTRAIREGLADLDVQQANAGTPYGVLFVRRPRGRWIAVQSVEQWCRMYYQAATS